MLMSNLRAKTIFCDIDGTLLLHHGDLHKQIHKEPSLLEGALERLAEWDKKGWNIILVTGRRESCREQTEAQLQKVGIFYDRLIMGIGGGDRVLINDRKPDSHRDTAHSINLERNEGIKNLEL
jgi:phosphoglycolate phosphatase-like HAD superfamily hydrolase